MNERFDEQFYKTIKEGYGMSEEMQVEGESSKQAREDRNKLIEMFGNLQGTTQIIVITKDLSGKKPDQVHVQGPMHDRVLLYGMLELARDIIALSFNKK